MTRVKCSYCGSTWNIEDEHIRARSKGGTIIVPACRACNRSKGTKSLSKWFDDLKRTDPYRWGRIVQAQKRKRSHIANLVRRRR
ncbi:MAG: HNH endonuclease [Candidatus Hodarchaeales archaeon]